MGHPSRSPGLSVAVLNVGVGENEVGVALPHHVAVVIVASAVAFNTFSCWGQGYSI